jgi:hypothetical protein
MQRIYLNQVVPWPRIVAFILLLAGISIQTSGLSSKRVRPGVRSANLPLASTKRNIIVPTDAPRKERIDAFLASQFSDISRSAFGSLCEDGKVFVNSKLGTFDIDIFCMSDADLK